MDEKKDRAVWFWRFVIFAAVAVVCSVMIILGSGFSGADNLTEIFGTGTFLRSETVYLTVILALLLPIVLIALTIHIVSEGRGYLWNGKKRKKKDNNLFDQ